tara:strand:+ start:672 stop:1331 length:660 start_codon:yes stop_codon:yes gene_type:complete
MKKFKILNDISIERNRRLEGRFIFDPHANVLWKNTLSLISKNSEKERLLDAYFIAKSINYNHPGLAPEIYFSHPIRVASLAMLYYGKTNVDLAVLGLIHNIYELSDKNTDYVIRNFGEKISNQILNLTVNRDLQWDQNYKRSYYKKIENDSLETCIVKIMDKLDNLFILGLNPDKEIKIKYLQEIEKFVLPLAKKVTPELHGYIKNLVEDNYNIGFNLK